MIELKYNFAPSGNSNEIWVIMDDDYNSENAASNTTSGAILLPSPRTVVMGQDNGPDVMYQLYAQDLSRPEVRNFLISVIVGSVKNHLDIKLCPGTSPTELFLSTLLLYITNTYGVVIGGDTGSIYCINPAYFDMISYEANSFGIECSAYLLHQWINGVGHLISPFRTGVPHASIF